MPQFERLAVMAMEVKEMDQASRQFLGLASTPQVDRAGEVVASEAMEAAIDNYMSNPVITWMHDSSRPIGKAISTKMVRAQGGKQTQIEVQLTDKTEAARDAWGLIEDGIVKSLSIGFNPRGGKKKGDPPAYDMDGETLVWRSIDWLETAVVSIPCNAGAQITFAKGLGLDMLKPETEQDLTEEERFFSDLARCKGGAEAVRNITKHWRKDGRVLSPEHLEHLLAAQAMLAEALQPYAAVPPTLTLPSGTLSADGEPSVPVLRLP